MASFSGFIRKSPSESLRGFLEKRGVDLPEDFDWTSEGRGTALVRSIEDLLEDLPDRQQDTVKAELELLASLSDDTGMTGATQVCAGQGIDLEGLEGVQDVLLMLATQHPRMIDRVNVQTSLMRRHGGKQWARFQFPDDGNPWVLDQQNAREGFLKDTVNILELPDHRKREADWYQSIRIHPLTGDETKLTQATIYIEEHAHSELAFGEESLERQTVQKVLEVGVVCDPSERIVEICAKGGKKLRDKYLQSFSANFAPQSTAPVEIPRRDVQLETLRQSPVFEMEPADGIERVEVSSLSFRSSDGGFVRVEKRAEDETLYQFLERRFGAASPLRAGGWQILAATLRIILAANGGKSSRTLTVTLNSPNTTTLPNKTETDRQFVYDLLERWHLLAPPPTSADLFEVIE
ncbi:hypothetical protein Q4577_06095 [Marinovum sp. 2_MG-2023]|uniref:hypothetical protein n=1 Tax=unclassified Marinovum TaxID=2647166 RepID=UPI0026E2F8EF|nr:MULTISPECIES: hypothetical protein [unclassified Marinovum]MDO6729581.1 hypothetical protein [Marinovum sp. 2_MG-2023]MDO6780265.1 hypothetical protein [Marinovum sp. 1_MG-2023]